MNILVSCNDHYGMPLMVMLTSLFSTNPCSTEKEHTVYMLEANLSASMNERIAACVRHFHAGYERLHLPDDPFASAKTKPYISKETYYRLLAAEYLPPEMERILWLDGDIIVRKNIGKFYHSPFEENMAIACGYGPAMRNLINENACSLGLLHPESYCNAGVMLLNLPECRKKITKEKISRLAESGKTERYLFPGQDVVNLLFDGKFKVEEYMKYNCMIHCITNQDDLAEAKINAAVVHFSGEAKPWKFNDIHFADEWLAWYKTCFGETADIKRMSYFRLKALYDRQRMMKK